MRSEKKAPLCLPVGSAEAFSLKLPVGVVLLLLVVPDTLYNIGVVHGIQLFVYSSHACQGSNASYTDYDQHNAAHQFDKSCETAHGSFRAVTFSKPQSARCIDTHDSLLSPAKSILFSNIACDRCQTERQISCANSSRHRALLRRAAVRPGLQTGHSM